jgi:hypothetical protein
MRVLVCGARDYSDSKKIWRILSNLQRALDPRDELIIIEGEARGADTIAKEWAEAHLPEENIKKFPADWDRYKRAAGPIRNKQMLEQGKPDLVLAFGGLNGRGTNNMVAQAKNAKPPVPVLEFDRDQE